MGIDWKTLLQVAQIVTPILLVIIIPMLAKIHRRQFLTDTKVDCTVYANKNLNGELKGFSEEWGKKYDSEFTRILGEKKFVDGK